MMTKFESCIWRGLAFNSLTLGDFDEIWIDNIQADFDVWRLSMSCEITLRVMAQDLTDYKWALVNPDRFHLMASPGYNELKE